MRVTMLMVALLLSFLASASNSVDDVYPSAQEMAGWCDAYRTATSDREKITVNTTGQTRTCYGAFLTAQQFATTTLDNRAHFSALKICAPANSDLLQLIKVFLYYVDGHPERGNEKFTDVLLTSWWEAWPCSPPLPKPQPVK